MEFVKLEKKDSGKFVIRYDVTYKTEAGNEKVYEMISRSKNMETFEDLQNKDNVEAVVLILHDKTGEKIMLNKEYRLAMGEWVYNFPAGLIDPGEDIKTAAARELKEETGLNLVEIKDVLAPVYSAVGFSNERSVCIVGTAEGEFAPSTSDEEEITPVWLTKEEVKEMLNTAEFAARTQTYCYLWAR